MTLKKSIPSLEAKLGTPEFFTDPFLVYDELFDTCVTLLIAGHETTTSLIANGLLQFLRHPGQSPVLAMHRRVTREMEHGGSVFAKGDLVYFVLASANRDPEFFSDPHEFNIPRPIKDNKQLAFGAGNHFCLGALLRRFPEIHLASEPHWKANVMVRFLQTLPLAAK
jgi:cytochrome P450